MHTMVYIHSITDLYPNKVRRIATFVTSMHPFIKYTYTQTCRWSQSWTHVTYVHTCMVMVE